jgi:hypothetical protein
MTKFFRGKMHNRLIQSFALIIIITALAASLLLSYTNAWAADSNDPTQGMGITSGAPTTCIVHCIIVGSPGPRGPQGIQGAQKVLSIHASITDNPNRAPAAAKNLTSCDSSLLLNIADKSPSRFKVMSPCVTVNGTITLIHTPSDGDTVFALALDKPFSTMVTKANFNPTMKGGIWVELICQRPNTSKEPVHKGDCNDPAHIINFPKPKVDDRVEVTGQYQQDIREGGHMEIHPVTALTKIQ